MPEPAPETEQQSLLGTMTFREHLIELRQRLMWSALAVIAGFFVAWQFHIELYALLSAPVREALANHNLFAIKAMAITESIEVYMKLALGGGLFLASPVVFWQLWSFVAPGLLDKEKRLMVPVLLGSVACFFLGAAFCYLAVLPFMTDFLVALTVDAPGLTLEPTLASTISFSLLMLVAFGAVFELPLFLYLLAALQLVTAQGLLKFWRYWVVIAFIIGAVLTPTPDPINQTLMSAPLVVLYGVGVGLAWMTQRKPGERLSRRTAILLAAVLTVLASAGVALAFRGMEPTGTASLPANALQIVGVHQQQLAKLTGYSASGDEASQAAAAAETLAPLRALAALKVELADPTVFLVRVAGGGAVVAEVADAEAVVRRAAAAAKVSATAGPSGLSAVLAADNSATPRRLRLIAAGKKLLWVGDDDATAALAAVRDGTAPALTAEEVVAGALDAVRTESAVWTLVPQPSGLLGWLPGGALRESVRLATATLDADAKRLRVRFVCKGPEAALALRDRLESWAADHQAGSGTNAASAALTERVAQLAGAVAAIAEAQARQLPNGSQDAQRLRETAREAHQAKRLLAEQLRLGGGVSTAGEGDATLTRALRAASQIRYEVHQSEVIWTVEAGQGTLLALLGAPAAAAPTALSSLGGVLRGVTLPEAATPVALPGQPSPGGR